MTQSVLRTVLKPINKLQTGPGFIHSADLNVHEAASQAYLPNNIFVQVRLHTGRRFGPGNPKRSTGGDVILQGGDRTRRLPSAHDKTMNQIQSRSASLVYRNTGWQRSEHRRVVIGRIQ